MKKLTLLLVVSIAMGLSACAKKKSSDARIGAGSGGRGDAVASDGSGGGGQVTSNLNPPCTTQYPYARILQDSAQAIGFRASYVNYFSAIDTVANVESALGDLDGTGQTNATGVNTQFQFKVVNGQMTSSVLNLIVYDSYSTQSGNTPIQIGYSAGSNNSYNASTGQFSTTFTDDYGSVVVSGTVQGNVVRAQVLFNNTKSADNSALKSGSLGSFQTASCAVVSQ